MEIRRIEGKGLGLVVNGRVSENEILIKVPYRAMMSIESMRKSGDFKEALEKDPILKEMPNIALALHILNEKMKGKDSPWSPYINILPLTFDSPLYFDAEDLLALKPSSFYFGESLKMWRNIARQFAYFSQILANQNNVLCKTQFTTMNFTFDAYRWATVTVMTRTNLVLDPAIGQSRPTLIPLIDLANHDATLAPSLGFLENENDHDIAKIATLVAAKVYNQNEEICFFYGRRTNGEFLLHNGFIDDTKKNENDTVVLELGLSKMDKLIQTKLACLKNIFPSDRFTISQVSLEHDLKSLYTFAVIFQTQNLEWLEELAQKKIDFNGNLPQILKNEEVLVKAKKFIKARLEIVLKSYSNNTKVPDFCKRAKLIVKLLNSEKEILQAALNKIDV